MENNIINNFDDIIVYFKNGKLQKILPSNTCNQYNAKYLISDGIKYDLENESDIQNIPVPNFGTIHTFPGISKSLDYVLRRKAGNLSNKGLFDLSITCLRKSNQLMSCSPIYWSKKDYFYIVLELTRADRFNEAKREKLFIEEHYFHKYDFQTLHNQTLEICLNNAKKLGTDLVEADSAPNCDAVCAKYRKRIYSLSGADARFPAMTNTILNSGLNFSPFIYGISRPSYCKDSEIVSFSNRPFVDERTEEEKENFIKFKKQRIFEDRKAEDFLEYRQICKFMSSSKPKSFKKYQEMKFAKTDDFLQLAQKAQEFGIDVEF